MMRKTVLATLPILIVSACALQAQSSRTKPAPNSDPNTPWIQKGYKVPRTPWGDPELQGVWAASSQVPLQRAANLGNKTHFTPEEYAAKNNRAGRAAATVAGTAADVHYDMGQYGLTSGTSVPDLRTALITSPADGRIPKQLPAAVKRNADRNAYRNAHMFDSTEFRSLSERCILWTSEGPPLTPGGYNPNFQIVQTKDAVAITMEMVHDTRVVDMTRKTHLPDALRQLFGDSIGHWEGDTLVVDTTNFTDRTAWQGSGTKLHVIERFRRTSDNDLEYSFTVEDPETWDQPWSALLPVPRSDSQTMYEYACHEGNYGMPNILSGIRNSENVE
jgi:hypothetical protein